MEILQTILTAIGSIITLFILTKLMGNREMSQLSMFDYINGITIGSIAAEMATSLFTDALQPFIAMIIYALFIIMISFITDKSIKARRLLSGKALVLYDNGKLYYKNLSKSRMDLNEFLTQCRINGYFDLANIQTAVLEANGKLSILPVSDQRPLTGKDVNITPPQDTLVANVIIDGKIMEQNLKYSGNNEKWLEKQLHANNISDISDIFLATCDSNNKLSVYKKITDEIKADILD